MLINHLNIMIQQNDTFVHFKTILEHLCSLFFEFKSRLKSGRLSFDILIWCYRSIGSRSSISLTDAPLM